MRDQLEVDGAQLRYLVVLSSSFSGTPGDNHPFHARAEAFRTDTGLQLVYLCAEDLARTAASVESRELTPTAREALDWATVFDHGIFTAGHLDTMLEA